MSLPVDPAMVWTLQTIPGYRVVRSLGVAEGVWVNPTRSMLAPFERSAVRDTISGAFVDRLVQAAKQGANAVVGLSFAYPHGADYLTVVAYGTAVIVEPER